MEKHNIVDFVQNKEIFSTNIEYLIEKSDIIEQIQQYCLLKGISSIEIDLLNNEYIDFKLINEDINETFSASIKTENGEVLYECDKYNKNEINKYIRNILADVLIMDNNELDTEFIKNLSFNTMYLQKPEAEKKHTIERAFKQIRNSKLFDEKQLKAIYKCMEQNIDVNLVACPIYNGNQMEKLIFFYNEFTKQTSPQQVNKLLKDFKNILIDNLKYPLTDKEFFQLWNSQLKGTLPTEIKDNEYRALLKCNYLFDRSSQQGYPIDKEYNGITFRFESIYHNKLGEQNSNNDTIKIVYPNGELETIYDAFDPSVDQVSLFVDAYIGNKIDKDLFNHFSLYNNLVKEHSDVKDFFVAFILADGNTITIKPYNDKNKDTNTILYNDIVLISPFLDDDSDHELIKYTVDKHGGIISVKRYDLDLNQQNINGLGCEIKILGTLKKDFCNELEKQHVLYRIVKSNTENGINYSTISIDNDNLIEAEAIYKNLLQNNFITLKSLSVIEDNIKKCMQENIIEYPINKNAIIKFEKHILKNKPVCKITGVIKNPPGEKILYDIIEKNNKSYYYNSPIIAAQFLEYHGNNLDQVINNNKSTEKNIKQKNDTEEILK